MARDNSNKANQKQLDALMTWINSQITPVEPTATIGNVDPSTRKPNKGVKRFFVGAGGDWGNLISPSWWENGLKQEAQNNIVNPVVDASKMSWADPNSGLSPTERLATFLNDALVATDLVTLGASGATKGASLLDDLARWNENRFMRGIHVSPFDDLKKIKSGSKFWLHKNDGGGFGDALPGYSYFFNTSMNPDFEQTVANLNKYAYQLQMNPRKGATFYTVKVPKSKVSPDANFYVENIYEALTGAAPSAVKKKGSMKIIDSKSFEGIRPRMLYTPEGKGVWYVDPEWKNKLKAIADYAVSSGNMKVSKKEIDSMYKNFLSSFEDTPVVFSDEGLSHIAPRSKPKTKNITKSIESRLKQMDSDMESTRKILDEVAKKKGLNK
jgi:hypothetical protein